ncbi:hypothetical protein FRC02_000240 [Tulasnella sp. 418]|nr:hypothetical protein FRC02_000240 [Tulasnella sp. 418]
MKTVSLLTALSLVGPSLAATAAEWQSRSIYQLLTDRFAKTTGEGGTCNTEDRRYCGGTWKGIINKLDYIKNMGFDAVWISPIVENIGGDTPYGQAYHGYWTLNINNLNSNYGTADDLKALSSALHAKGMYLMVDIVVNHVAATTTPPTLTYDGYAPFNQATDYHSPFCFIKDYQNQTDVENCSIGDDKVALVDLNTNSDRVKQTFNDWVKKLVQDYSIDGLRIDTVKHVQKDFYPEFVKAAGVFTLGEVLDTRFDYTGDYTNYMDAVFNYPEWYNVLDTFQNSTGNIQRAVDAVSQSAKSYKGGGLLSTSSFSENHDNARLPARIPDPILVKNIITWTFVGDGMPTLYYGQEASYAGAEDPANREALWFTSYSADVSLYKYITKLNAARKLAITNKSFLSTPRKVVSSDAHNIAISKAPLLSVFTNGGQGYSGSYTVTNTGLSSGTTLVDVASDNCDTVNVANDGSVAVTYSNGNPKIYLPSSALTSSGLCGSKAGAAKSAASPSTLRNTGLLGLSVAAALGYILA